MADDDYGERFARVEFSVGRLEDDVKEIRTELEGRRERLAKGEGRLGRVEEDVRDIEVALNGPPRSESVRGRLHLLETSEAATRAAEAALRMAGELQDRRLTKWEKVTAMSFGVLFAAATLVTTAITVAHQFH